MYVEANEIKQPDGGGGYGTAFQFVKEGMVPSPWVFGYWFYPCLASDTEVYVYDRKKKGFKKKKIQDVDYDDELLVWDFDNGCFTTAKPLWIKKKEITDKYNLIKFSNGSELKTINDHRIFNKEKGAFTYTMAEDTPVGTTTFTSSGEETKLISKEVIYDEVTYYNIITDYHMNLFTNDILTSCRLNNIYPIKDMKFVKDDRKLKSIDDYDGIEEKWFKGLRLAEQQGDINKGNARYRKSYEDYIKKMIELQK